MRFSRPLLPGKLIKRYKRFFADIELDSGEIVTALTPNTGSMKGVCVPGNKVLISDHRDTNRKVKFGWELIAIDGKWVGINTQIPNIIAREAFESGLIPAFCDYKHHRGEVYIADDTRIDFLLSHEPTKKQVILSDQHCWVEVKNVTLVEDGVAKFPDSVSARGTKHLEHLISAVKNGQRAAMLYVVQHHAGEVFRPADEIDPVYGKTFRKAMDEGVNIEVWKAHVSPEEIRLSEKLLVKL